MQARNAAQTRARGMNRLHTYILPRRKENALKISTLNAGLSSIGAVCLSLIGGWSHGVIFLLWCNVLDYVLGAYLAYALKKSPKTAHGGASSAVGFIGIARKCCIWVLVAVGHQIGVMVGTPALRDILVIAYIVNELTSIVENMGLMGVYIPEPLRKAIDILRGKSA